VTFKLVGIGPHSVTFRGDQGMVSFSGKEGVTLTYVLGKYKGQEEVRTITSTEIFQIREVQVKKWKEGESKVIKVSFVIDTTLYVVNIQN